MFQVQELSEKDNALQGELGRLRQHLLAVEEQYTEEALRNEQLASELRCQLAAAEERARNTVTSLSSARLVTLDHMIVVRFLH